MSKLLDKTLQGMKKKEAKQKVGDLEDAAAQRISDQIKRKFPNKTVTGRQVEDEMTTIQPTDMRDYKYFHAMVYEYLEDGGWKIAGSKEAGIYGIENIEQAENMLEKRNVIWTKAVDKGNEIHFMLGGNSVPSAIWNKQNGTLNASKQADSGNERQIVMLEKEEAEIIFDIRTLKDKLRIKEKRYNEIKSEIMRRIGKVVMNGAGSTKGGFMETVSMREVIKKAEMYDEVRSILQNNGIRTDGYRPMADGSVTLFFSNDPTGKKAMELLSKMTFSVEPSRDPDSVSTDQLTLNVKKASKKKAITVKDNRYLISQKKKAVGRTGDPATLWKHFMTFLQQKVNQSGTAFYINMIMKLEGFQTYDQAMNNMDQKTRLSLGRKIQTEWEEFLRS